MNCSMPGFPVHHQLPELTQTHVHWIGDAIKPFQPLSFPLLLPSIFPSIRVFSKGHYFTSGGQSAGVSASACLSNEYSGLISFKIDLLDLLAVQGTLKSLLQHHSSKASILQGSGTDQVSFISLTFLVEFGRKVGKALFLLFRPQVESLIQTPLPCCVQEAVGPAGVPGTQVGPALGVSGSFWSTCWGHRLLCCSDLYTLGHVVWTSQVSCRTILLRVGSSVG